MNKYLIKLKYCGQNITISISGESNRDAVNRAKKIMPEIISVERVESKMPEMPEQFKSIFNDMFGGFKN
jgi:hypothetical protein